MDQTKEYLKELIRITKKDLTAVGYQQLTVTGGSPQSLTVPTDASYCEIRVVSATTSGVIMYYNLLNGVTAPTTSSGMPLTYLDLFDIKGNVNLNAFRVIAVSGTHTLNIQYFK